MTMTGRNQKLLFAVFIATAGVLVAGGPAPVPDPTGWRRLLSFDVMKAARRSADIGNHTILIAEGDGSRWDIEVRRYPLSKNTENLLYDGHNWHGLQAWDILPMFVTNNPHVNIVTYDKGKSQLMIVARGYERTPNRTSGVEFITGTLEVFHKP